MAKEFIWKVGYTKSKFGSLMSLPTNRDALQVLLFYHKPDKKEPIRKSSKLVIDQLEKMYKEKGITTRKTFNLLAKIENLYKSYKNLRKNRNNSQRRTKGFILSEDNFYKDLDYVFDISHESAVESMTEAQKEFFNSQNFNPKIKRIPNCNINKKKIATKNRKSIDKKINTYENTSSIEFIESELDNSDSEEEKVCFDSNSMKKLDKCLINKDIFVNIDKSG